jgi:4-hydroxy-tetrahydrodipicolinate reductase
MIATRLLNELSPESDIEVIEEHFADKEKPSSTAVRIGKNLDIDLEKNIHSVRAGGIVGRHQVIFGLPNQTIRVTHESVNRKAFAQGALFAARHLMRKDKGFYTMENLIEESISLDLYRREDAVSMN